jgi:hypothetical protein
MQQNGFFNLFVFALSVRRSALHLVGPQILLVVKDFFLDIITFQQS